MPVSLVTEIEMAELIAVYAKRGEKTVDDWSRSTSLAVDELGYCSGVIVAVYTFALMPC